MLTHLRLCRLCANIYLHRLVDEQGCNQVLRQVRESLMQSHRDIEDGNRLLVSVSIWDAV